MREPDLKALNTSRNQLITSSAEHYVQTAQWAEAIHHQNQSLDGLAWTSNRCDPETSYLFFGDRVSSTDLQIIYTRRGDPDTKFLEDVVRLGWRSRIEVSISSLK